MREVIVLKVVKQLRQVSKRPGEFLLQDQYSDISELWTQEGKLINMKATDLVCVSISISGIEGSVSETQWFIS